MAHEGTHSFYLPDEDPTKDKDPEITRCTKVNNDGSGRCTYKRAAIEVSTDRIKIKEARIGIGSRGEVPHSQRGSRKEQAHSSGRK